MRFHFYGGKVHAYEFWSLHILYTLARRSIEALTTVTSGWEEKKQRTFFCFLFARPTFCNMNMDSIGNENNTN